jgi:hypothetical protein
MGKVGQVFHPNQDRIVSVRECARSQVGGGRWDELALEASLAQPTAAGELVRMS